MFEGSLGRISAISEIAKQKLKEKSKFIQDANRYSDEIFSIPDSVTSEKLCTTDGENNQIHHGAEN